MALAQVASALLVAVVAQAPPTRPSFDGRRLLQRVDSFAAYYIRDDDTSRSGTSVASISADGTMLMRVYVSDDPNGGQTDTIFDRLSDLLPVRHSSQSPWGSGNVRFGRGTVTGWTQLANGDTVAVSTPIPPRVYNAASFDLLVRASDLHEGFEFTVQGFRMGSNVVVTMRGRVTGTEIVDGHPCWVFAGTNGPVPVTFWVDQETRALRRQLIQGSATFFHMLSSMPPKELAVSDSEKAGLVVDGAWLRHDGLGFTLPTPGNLVLDTAETTRLNLASGDPSLYSWMARPSTGSSRVVVSIELFKSFTGTDRAARSFARGMRRVFAPEKGYQILQDSLWWEGTQGELRLAARRRDGPYVRMRCLPAPEGRTPRFLMCAQTTTSFYTDTFDFVLDELRFAKDKAAEQFDTPTGRFAIWFPRDPQLSQGSGAGGLRFNRFKVVVDSTMMFYLNYADYSESEVAKGGDSLLIRDRQSFATALKGKVRDDRAIRCGTHPGRTFQIKSERDYHFRLKLCYAAPRMYLMYVVGFTEPPPDSLVARFLESFRIIDAEP